MNNVLRFSEFLNESASRKNITTIQDFVKELQSFDSKIKLEVPGTDVEINTLNNKEFEELVNAFSTGKYDDSIELLIQRVQPLLSRPAIKSMSDLLLAIETYDKGNYVSDVVKEAMKKSKASGATLAKLIKLYNNIPRASRLGGQTEYNKFMDKVQEVLKKEKVMEPTRTLGFWRMNFYDDGNTSFEFMLPAKELEAVKRDVEKYFKTLAKTHGVKDSLLDSFDKKEDISGSIGISYYPQLWKVKDYHSHQNILDQIKEYLIGFANKQNINLVDIK
jgi:hypothetical protein